MRKIKSFNEFVNEAWEDIRDDVKGNAAGLCIVCNNKILLVKDGSDGTLGIPKGKIDKGESEIQAAIRETYEETGIKIDRSKITPEPYVVHVYKGDKIKKQLIYFIVQLASLAEIGLSSEIIAKKKIQAEEISWAGFLPPDKAYAGINRTQLIILDRHLNL